MLDKATISQYIRNAVLVTDIFGYWPSFHDAEIVSIRLERAPDVPYLEAVIDVFQMTDEINVDGYYVNKNNTLVTLRFSDLQLHSLDSFNHQNVLFELTIEPKTDSDFRFAIAFSSSYGCEAHFDCNTIEVIQAEPKL